MNAKEVQPRTRVLVVEDTPNWQTIIQRALAGEEYRVECVAEGEVALAVIEDDPPDMLLLDVHLPGTNGFEVLEELRSQARFADLPVLVLTSESRASALLRSFELGADDYMSKPFQAPELRARITSKLRVKALQDQVKAAAEANARELEMARGLQCRFLPLPPPPRPGIDLVACYRPSSTLGGDYFDVLDLGEDVTGLFLADVVGHGAPAALVTSFLKALSVHGQGSQAEKRANPGAWMSETSRDLLATFPGLGLFVTAVFAIVDPDTERLVYVNAGHCEPILQRRGGDLIRLEGASLPLGISEKACYEPREVEFRPGERLFLYTDGIQEQRHHASKELFGRERLLETLSDLAGAELGQVVAEVERAVLEWAGGELADDVNILACERSRSSS